jgi:hypothetical protein
MGSLHIVYKRSGIKLNENVINPFLLTCLVFRKLNFKWAHILPIRRKLSEDPEIMREYNLLLSMFSNNILNLIANFFKVELVVDKTEKIESYGNGPSIFLKLKNQNWYLFTEGY